MVRVFSSKLCLNLPQSIPLCVELNFPTTRKRRKCLRIGIHGQMDFSIGREKGGLAGIRVRRAPPPSTPPFFGFYINFESNRVSVVLCNRPKDVHVLCF